MKSVAAFFLVLFGTASVAHGEGYVAVAVGSHADLGGDLAVLFRPTEDSNPGSGRLAVGQRFGRLALEASLFGTELGASPQSSLYATVAAGVDLKYYIELGGALEAYGRGGLNKTWLVPTQSSNFAIDYSGRGRTFGAGLQYTLRLLPLGEAAFFIDYAYQVIQLASTSSRQLLGTAEMVTFGVALGL